MNRDHGPDPVNLIVALDVDDPGRADAIVQQLDPTLTRLKVGKQLFTLAGPGYVERLQQRGFDVFLDLKFHDIPNTVAGAVAAAASLGVWMVNVHASGGPRMLDAARNAVARMNPVGGGSGGTRLIAVTVLTSHTEEDLRSVGIAATPDEQVERLVALTLAAGIDGVVCSARECQALRKRVPDGFLLVTPGIRPAGSDAGDQRRVLSPSEAIAAGADHLVIGRPITDAADPAAALRACADDVHAARAGNRNR